VRRIILSSILRQLRSAGGEGVQLVWRCKKELTRLAQEVATLRESNQKMETARCHLPLPFRRLCPSDSDADPPPPRRREDEVARRRLHNAIQELKGNIRVYCRIRPVRAGIYVHRQACLIRKHEPRGMQAVKPSDVSRPPAPLLPLRRLLA
jgi:hypothetical protein